MDLSIVLPTYNRRESLEKAISALLNQQTTLEYELIVVDNNSTDGTAEKVAGYVQKDPRLRYGLECRQGVAYARNTGISAARADLIAFTDDDVCAAPDWVQRIHQAAEKYPDADFIGGAVLPVWTERQPSWLSSSMAPLALLDRGNEPFVVSQKNPICLLTACLAVRRRAFDKVGLFDPELQRVKDGIGSIADADFERKLWKNGGQGMYVPDVICYCQIPAERLSKAYHRRWHLGHGKFNAIRGSPELDIGPLLLNVPRWLYRYAFTAAISTFVHWLKGAAVKSFDRESDLLFCLGFIKQRWKILLSRLAG
jgi:glucosyl-dolichyl phosphate glucuronosyltransferase